jgi:tetratricopeptide (TPR) repeat protein
MSALPQVVARIQARDFAGAAEAAQGALLDTPDNADLLHLLALAQRQLGRVDQAIGALERATAIDPLRATLHFNLGQAYGAVGKQAEAIHSLERALAIDPSHARARFDLACLHRATGNIEGAEQALRHALTHDPADARVHNELAATLLDRGRPDLALPVLKAGLVQAPDLAVLHGNLGNALRDIGRPGPAIAAYDRAIALSPGHIELQLNRAHALLRAGRLAEGFAAYEVRLRRAKMVRQSLADAPVWSGEPIEGKRLLIHAEQGHGDSIQFVRYARLARRRGAKVILECQERLLRLFAAQPEPLADTIVTNRTPLPEFDLRVPMMSLPACFGTDFDSIPAAPSYLAPVPGLRFDLPAAPADARLKIGLVWAGNPGHHQDRLRSCALEALRPLLALPETAIYPLQLEVGETERAILSAHPGVVWIDREQRDFADAASAIMQLDLVVTVDTAMAHLAGALGVPALLLLSLGADWRWMVDRDDSPWYPSLRLLRQVRPGDWAGVVRQLVERVRVAPSRVAA